MEFLLFLVVVVAGIVIWGKARAAKRAKSEPLAQGSSGKLVGGWLAFLILALIVLAPIGNAVRIALDLNVAEHVNGSLKDMDAWSSFKVAAWLNYLGATAIGIFAGLGLLLKRNKVVVWRAIAALWLTGPIGTFVYGYVLPKLYLGQPAPKFDSTLFVAVLAALIWTLYLLNSKRVKATYQEQSQGAKWLTLP